MMPLIPTFDELGSARRLTVLHRLIDAHEQFRDSIAEHDRTGRDVYVRLARQSLDTYYAVRTYITGEGWR